MKFLYYFSITIMTAFILLLFEMHMNIVIFYHAL